MKAIEVRRKDTENEKEKEKEMPANGDMEIIDNDNIAVPIA